MPTLTSFEDIGAWRKSRELTNLVYLASRSGKFAKDYGLCNQIRRSAVSIMSNIAEGFERGGNREFIQFLSIANGSASETESLLYVAMDNEYISTHQFEKMQQLVKEIKSMIHGFIMYLKRSNISGIKFK